MTDFCSRQPECDLIAVQRNNALKFNTWLLVMDESTGINNKKEEMGYLKSNFFFFLLIPLLSFHIIFCKLGAGKVP